jgi:tetratricopeptide (TPR) repeat protein
MMAPMRAFFALLCLAAVFFFGAGARAEDAATLFAEGQAHYAAGRYPEAYTAYKRAFEIKPSYDCAGNLGNVEVKLGRYAEAVGHLQYVLDYLPPSLDAATRESVIAKTNERLAEAKRHVAIYTLTVSPDGATVTLDGAAIGTTPLAAPLVAGEGDHVLVLSKSGYASYEHRFRAQPNTTDTLSLTMTPGGGGPQAGRIAVGVVGGVLALGAIGAGIGLLVASSSNGDDREALAGEFGGNTGACANGNPDPRCSELQSLADDEVALRGAGIGLLVAGGVLAAATVITVIVWPSSSGGDTALTIGPGGFSFRGRF